METPTSRERESLASLLERERVLGLTAERERARPRRERHTKRGDGIGGCGVRGAKGWSRGDGMGK